MGALYDCIVTLQVLHLSDERDSLAACIDN